MVYPNIFHHSALLSTIKQPSVGLSLPGYHKTDIQKYSSHFNYKIQMLIQICFVELVHSSVNGRVVPINFGYPKLSYNLYPIQDTG